MISQTQKALRTLVDLRIEVAMGRLKENPHYLEICVNQAATEVKIREVFQDAENYFENQSIRDGLEFNEIYIQGLKDGIHFLKFLGVVNREEDL